MGTSSSRSYESSSVCYVAPQNPPQYPSVPAAGGLAPQGAAGARQSGFGAFQSPTMKFRAIKDQYNTVEEVQEALRKAGLESSNLIVAVDFTKSNEWTGKQSFGGKSLHAIGDVPSPYEDAITAIGKTLSAFDDDGFIPAYGFGDATTGDRSVFSFLPDDKPCQGLEQVLWRYRELCPYVRMAGPTSFAPAIRQACRIVEQAGFQYHILLIVADGQVSRSSDLLPGQYSGPERDTIDAIVEASYLPLSIVMVGVGDGPWDLMRDFDDALPERHFDNFQFVNFTDLMRSTPGSLAQREAVFALRALMEVPEQYQIIQRLGLLSSRTLAARAGSARRKLGNPPLDPPVPANVMSGVGSGGPRSSPYSGSAAAAAPRGSGAGSGSTAKHSVPNVAADKAGKLDDEKDTQPDPMFLCPITQDVMKDPVIAMDGYTYERSAITSWLDKKTVSPMTNAPMPGGATLIPNHGLRSAILQWMSDKTKTK